MCLLALWKKESRNGLEKPLEKHTPGDSDFWQESSSACTLSSCNLFAVCTQGNLVQGLKRCYLARPELFSFALKAESYICFSVVSYLKSGAQAF